MSAIDGYIVRATLLAFLLIVVSLTGVIWITQALRGIDLMTNQGQTILVFLSVTGLLIPLLMLVIAPIALLIAVIYVLNKLAADSEIIVMSSAGMPPWRIFRPFVVVTAIVASLLAIDAAYLAPDGMRRIKFWNIQITTDVLANILQRGRFMEMEPGLTLRIRDRNPEGDFVGIFIDDRRDPKERLSVIADRGSILKNESGSFLILDRGNLQRFEQGRRDPVIVEFDRYALDMTKYASRSNNLALSERERYLWELLWPEPDDKHYQSHYGAFRAELHSRLVAPLYPFAMIVLTFAFLGAPRTTRQGRMYSILMAVMVTFTLRIASFGLTVGAAKMPWLTPLNYALLIGSIIAGIMMIVRGYSGEPPPRLVETINELSARLTRRLAPS